MNSGHLKASENQNRSINAQSGLSAQDGDQSHTIPTQRLAPTQRVSEVCCSPCFVVDVPLTLRGFEDYLTEPNQPSYATVKPTRFNMSHYWHLHSGDEDLMILLPKHAQGSGAHAR